MDDPFKPIDEPRVVYDGEGVTVVAKPAGMHCAPGSEPGTLCAWLFDRKPSLATVRGWRADEGGLLHRLDSATSGLVAFASDDLSWNKLAKAAAEGSFVKSYHALCSPSPGGLAGSRPVLMSPAGVDLAAWMAALRRDDLAALSARLSGVTIRSFFRPYGPGAQRVACAVADGDAERGIARGKAWTKEPYATTVRTAVPSKDGLLLDVELVRGFRHQVRAHLAWLGLPLRGDDLYGELEETLRLRAYRLAFPDPLVGTRRIVDIDACQ